MTSNYNDIFSKFLGKVTCYDFLNIDEQEFYDTSLEYLHSVFARPYIKAIFEEIKFDDEVATIEWKLSSGRDEEVEKYYVEDVFAQGLVVAWLEPQVKNQALIKQFIGTSKEKVYSQQQHLSQLQSLLETSQTNLRKMIRDDGYIHNEYIEK